ncbi:nuclear transport factor 2 family protein [Streptomyces sp. M19]
MHNCPPWWTGTLRQRTPVTGTWSPLLHRRRRVLDARRTDGSGSAQIAEQLRKAMESLPETHDEVTRVAVDGAIVFVEMVFRGRTTQGNAFEVNAADVIELTPTGRYHPRGGLVRLGTTPGLKSAVRGPRGGVGPVVLKRHRPARARRGVGRARRSTWSTTRRPSP